jgi:hypothetical protein
MRPWAGPTASSGKVKPVISFFRRLLPFFVLSLDVQNRLWLCTKQGDALQIHCFSDANDGVDPTDMNVIRRSSAIGCEKKFQAYHVVHEVHAQALIQLSRAVADIPEGAIDV